MRRRTTGGPKSRPAGTRGRAGEWQLQDAKARFSEVFRLARSREPQRVTRHGKEAVVVLPAEEFERLSGRERRDSLVEFFANSPLAGSGIVLERREDYGRPVSL
jgi:prevent-host-death family protein